MLKQRVITALILVALFAGVFVSVFRVFFGRLDSSTESAVSGWSEAVSYGPCLLLIVL